MPDDPFPKVALIELRSAVERLLEAVEGRFGETVQLGADPYWTIAPSDAFDVESQPPLYAGELSDDVETIRELISRRDREEDEVRLGHDLEHLVGILTRLADLADR